MGCKTPKFDIAILGAGISGLLLASELSKELSIILIEKKSSIPSHKYWLTNKDCIKDNPELVHCIDNEYDYLDFVGYNNVKYTCSGNYILWDTNRLINHLYQTIVANDCPVMCSTQFYSYEYVEDRINISAGDKKYSVKLVIDCMGYSSPIVNAKGIIDIKGYYHMFGKKLKLRERVNPIGLQNIILQSSSKYFELFPLKNEYAFAAIISTQSSTYSSKSILEEFEFIVNDSHMKSYFDNTYFDNDSVNGIIPVGNLNTRALNKIFFYGEAGQLNPATSATALTIMLKQYKDLAKELVCVVKENRTDRKNLLALKNIGISNLATKFQLKLFMDVMKWDSDKFANFVEQMQFLDDKLVFDIIFGELNLIDILKQKQLLKILSPNNYLFKNFVKSILS